MERKNKKKVKEEDEDDFPKFPFFCENVTHGETDHHTDQWTEKPFY